MIKEWTNEEKMQMKVFLTVNFGLTALMGIIMWISYHNGNDVTAFAATQMMYPAAGVVRSQYPLCRRGLRGVGGVHLQLF